MLITGEVQGILWYGPEIDNVEKGQIMDNQDCRVDMIMNNADSISLLITISITVNGPSFIKKIAR